MSVSHNLEYFRQRIAQMPGVYIDYDAIETQHMIAVSIVTERLAQGLTQADLAARAGLSQTEISRIESGFSNPTAVTLNRVAAALGKTITLSDMKDL